MNFEKGQIVIVSIPSDKENSVQKYLLIAEVHDVLPIISGYIINPIVSSKSVTDVPLVPNAENNIKANFSIDMSKKYLIDSHKVFSIFGHLKDSELVIIKSYEHIFAENNLTAVVGSSDLNEKLRNQYNLLCLVIADDYEAVKEMLNVGINIEEYQLTTTLLHYAVKNDAMDTAAVIIAEGEFIDAIDKDEKTPLFYAVENNNRDMATMLVNKGANPLIRVMGRTIYELAKSDKMRKILEPAKKAAKENEVFEMLQKEERMMSR